MDDKKTCKVPDATCQECFEKGWVCIPDAGPLTEEERLKLNQFIKLQSKESRHHLARGVIPWKEGDELPEDVIRRMRDGIEANYCIPISESSLAKTWDTLEEGEA